MHFHSSFIPLMLNRVVDINVVIKQILWFKFLYSWIITRVSLFLMLNMFNMCWITSFDVHVMIILILNVLGIMERMKLRCGWVRKENLNLKTFPLVPSVVLREWLNFRFESIFVFHFTHDLFRFYLNYCGCWKSIKWKEIHLIGACLPFILAKIVVMKKST